MKLFGMFKLDEMMSKNFKYKLPFSFNTIEQKYKDLLIQKGKNPEAKQKRIHKYCRAVRKFAKRLLRDSKFDEQFMSQFTNCRNILQALHSPNQDSSTNTSL